MKWIWSPVVTAFEGFIVCSTGFSGDIAATGFFSSTFSLILTPGMGSFVCGGGILSLSICLWVADSQRNKMERNSMTVEKRMQIFTTMLVFPFLFIRSADTSQLSGQK